MAKIIYRPEPPPDVNSNKAVRRSETFLNKEASAGLFEQSLVKAQGQKQAVQNSVTAELGQEHQVESDADSLFGLKSRDSVLAATAETHTDTRADTLTDTQSANLSAAEEAAELEEIPEDAIDVADEGEQDTDSTLSSADTPSAVEVNATVQMFENIRDLNSSAESSQHTDTTASSADVNNEQDVNLAAQTAVAHSVSTTPSLESRVSSMSSMSDLIDMLETSSRLPEGNDWTLILEDDGPVSELTLSSDTDGRWNIGLQTSFDSETIDANMISDLRNQLDTAGIAVADIAFVDRAPTATLTTTQPNNVDSSTHKAV